MAILNAPCPTLPGWSARVTARYTSVFINQAGPLTERSIPRSLKGGVAVDDYLEYSDLSHSYWRNGVSVVSVTQVLFAAGLVSPFAVNAAAAARGHLVHKLTAQMDIEGRLDMRSVPRPLRGYIDAWKFWKLMSGFEVEAVEGRVDCREPSYAGRFDRAGRRPGSTRRTVVDLKTGQPGKSTGLQLVAYCHGLAPGEVMERIAVQLTADGSFHTTIYPIGEFQADLSYWLRLVSENNSTRLTSESTKCSISGGGKI